MAAIQHYRLYQCLYSTLLVFGADVMLTEAQQKAMSVYQQHAR